MAVRLSGGRADLLAAPVCGLLALALYSACLCPTVGPGDSGELTLAAWRLGIAHPPGYPLFTWLGRLATLFPVEPALATNLLTALIAAAAVACAWACGRELGQSRPAAAVSALVFAFSSSFWTSSLCHEVYALSLLFLFVLVLLVLRCGVAPRLLPVAGFVLGLSVAHQPTSLLWLPGLALLFAARRTPGRNPAYGSWLTAVTFVLGLSSSLGLLFLARSRPAINWGSPDNLGRFLTHVTAGQYRDLALAADRATVLARLVALPRTLASELTIPGLLLALAGLVALFRANWRAGLALLLVVLTAGFGLSYLVPDYVVHLMPALAALALAAGSGVDLLAGRFGRWRVAASTCLALVAILPGLILHLPAAREYRSHAFGDLGRDLLASLPDSSVFVFGADVVGNTARYARALARSKPRLTFISARMLLSEAYWNELRQTDSLPGFAQALRSAGAGPHEERLQLMLRTVLAALPGRPVYCGSELLTQWFFAGPLARDLRPVPQGIVNQLVPASVPLNIDAVIVRDAALWSAYHLDHARRAYRNAEFGQVPVTYALSRNNLGMFLLECGRPDLARAFIESALAFPTPPEFRSAVERNRQRLDQQ